MPIAAAADAAADDIGGVRTRHDVEHQPGQDEEPEFVNPEHDTDFLASPRQPKGWIASI